MSLKVRRYACWLTFAFSGFVAFDAIKAALQDENGKISGPRTVVAGFGAGFTESLVAVTPFESIKTQLFVVTPYPQPDSIANAAVFSESTTGNRRTRACVASFTEARSYSKKEEFVVSSKGLCRLQPDKQPTRQPGLPATQL